MADNRILPEETAEQSKNENSRKGLRQARFFAALNKKLHLRISTKISLVFGLIFLILGAIAVLTTFLVSNTFTGQEATARAVHAAELVATVTEENKTALKEYFDKENMLVRLEKNGQIWFSDKEFDRVEQDTKANGIVTVTRRIGDSVVTVAYRYHLYPMSAEHATLIATLVVSWILVILLGAFASKVILYPIRDMTKTTRLITKDALDTRLDTEETQDELKELAEVINNMLDNLQVTLQSQERFVGDASHEMRTPIAVIKGYASMLQRWGATDKAILQESIDAIAKEAENMQKLIDNLLFLSRTDRDVLKVSFESFALSEIVDETLKEAEMVDTEHIYQAGRREVTDVVASPDMVKQLLRIIIENAKKYTPKGGAITVECYSTENAAVMSVRDQGIGIAKTDLDHVFDRFYRADKARNRSGGTGLGMSIAKKIADVHGGEIILESKVGEGTLVTIFLPKTQEDRE